MVGSAEPHEVGLFHQITLGAFTIRPQAVRVRFLSSIGIVVAKNVAMAIDADSDVLVPVYFVHLECIERVALLGARF